MKFIDRMRDRFFGDDPKTMCVFLLFFLLCANYLVYSFLGGEGLKNYFRLAIIALIAGYCIWRFVNKKIDAAFLTVLGTATATGLMGGTLSLNVSFLLLLALFLVGMASERINKMAFYANVILLIFVLACLILGLVENTHYVNSDGRGRFTFGFSNVNAASSFAFSMATTYLLSKKESRHKFVIGVLITFSVVYLVTDSRTAFWCLIFLVLFWLAAEYLPKKISKLLVCLFVILMFLSPCIWELPVVNQGPIDDLMSDRPTFFIGYMAEHTLANLLFGGSTVTEVDNFYLLLLYNAGIFVYAACGIVVLFAFIRLLKRGRTFEVGFCLTMLLYGQLEGILLRPEILCVPIFWYYIFRNFTLDSVKDELVSLAAVFKPKKNS